MVPSWLLDEVAKQLESQAERQQIHQLTFAVNQHNWPDDPNILDLYRLRDLVQDLTRSYASFEELKQALRRALTQAPQGKAFIPAARTLLKVIRQAYQGDGSAAALPSEASLGGFQPGDPASQSPSPFETRVSQVGDREDSSGASRPAAPLPYEDIAATLQQSPSATRVKKLLYAVCSGEWSNDPVMLGRFRLTNLIKQIHKMSANEETLHSALRNVVVTLNRQMEYELVAQLIQRECHRLYSHAAESASHSYGEPSLIEPALSYDAVYEEEPLSTGPGSSPGTGVEPVPLGFYDDDLPEPTGVRMSADLLAADPLDALQSIAPQPDAPQDSADQPTVAQGEPARQALTAHYDDPAIAEEAAIAQQPLPLDWDGLAELRVELMRYANPLRVKALIFSTLYFPFELSADADWSKLQGETLSNLLVRLIEQFASHSHLNEQLQLTAGQLMPSDEYGNAAGAIARALRPFYP